MHESNNKRDIFRTTLGFSIRLHLISIFDYYRRNNYYIFVFVFRNVSTHHKIARTMENADASDVSEIIGIYGYDSIIQ